MDKIVAILVDAISVLPQAIALGIDVAGTIQKIRDAHDSGADPDDSMWRAVNDDIAALRRRLHTDPPEPPVA